jgi:two-component system NarL family sensor kinase
LVTGRGEARRQLGRDLHDGVGHQLTGLAQKLEHTTRLSMQDAERAEPLFREVGQQLVSLTHEIRTMAHRLYPPELELLGLVGALHERTLSQPHVQIVLEAPEELPDLSAEIETAVYYITLEALTNIAKHAQAQHCQIRLNLLPSGMLELDIHDDGIGLAQPALNGMGMLSMQARAVEVGGTFSIDAQAGKGTTIHVRIPCPTKGG